MWYHDLENQIVPVAYTTARAVCDHVERVDLRLENGALHVVVEHRPTDQERISIIAAVKHALFCRVADPQRLNLIVSRGFRLLYTSHLHTTASAPKKLYLQSITRFTIRLSEVIALRDIYTELVRLADSHDFVATVALGGIPGLVHLVENAERREKPEDHADLVPFYDRLRAKYLCAGLLWSGTDREADAFFAWMKTIPSGSSLLLFDTGTVGNRVRRLFNVITERWENETELGLRRVTILGVVDGQVTSQRIEQKRVHAGEETALLLTYHHVPRVLSEDCQELLGFESSRQLAM
jgi:hypothetical protein